MIVFLSIIWFLMQLTLISTNNLDKLVISDKEYASMPKLFHLDDYDRCKLYGDEALYCMINFQLKPIKPENSSKTWKIIKELSSDSRNYRHDLLWHGVCVSEIYPNTTRNPYRNKEKVVKNLETYYSEKYRHLGLKSIVTETRCELENSPHVGDTYDILFVAFIFAYSIILISATIYEMNISSKNKEQYEKMMESSIGKFTSAISIRKNWQRLMTVHLPTEEMQVLRSIQGFRFYNMVWVIFFHSTGRFLTQPISNPIFLEKVIYKKKFLTHIIYFQMMKETNHIILDVTHTMQIFFMISTFLFTYNFLQNQEKLKKLTINYFMKTFIKRYIRLTPVLAFTIAFTSTWLIHVSRGPLWDHFVGKLHRRCRTNWWTNLLYINNFINVQDMCVGHSWYLAVNTQFCVLCFLLLCLIRRYPKKIVHILASLFILHILCLFLIFYRNNWPHMFKATFEFSCNEGTLKDQTFQFMHASLATNSAGVIVGLMLGYIFYKHRNRRFCTKKFCIFLWWTLSIGLPLAVILTDSWFVNNSRFYSALYGSLRRITFAFGSGMMLLGIIQGQGWLLKWLCEGSPIYILGRLTYCAYIIHPVMQRIQPGIQREPNFIGYHILYDEPVGDIVLAFLGALFLTLFIELPIIELEKHFTTKQKFIKIKSK